MGVKCFFLEPTNSAWVKLRRFKYSEPGDTHYHDAAIPFGTCNFWKKYDDDEGQQGDWTYADDAPEIDHSDPRWPTHCECGYAFTPDDQFQVSRDHIFRRTDTGELLSLRKAPPGAMYDAEWLPQSFPVGEDGRRLYVVCPSGITWCIDGRASNCTMPEDNNHKCWVRHGTVPQITVDKNGVTCAAGGGSIIAGNYHGFLRNGEFTENM